MEAILVITCNNGTINICNDMCIHRDSITAKTNHIDVITNAKIC